MKLQQNKAGNYFIYIPSSAVKELGLKKSDNVKVKITKIRTEDVDSRNLQ